VVIGTLKSTRTSTRLPCTSSWSMLLIVFALRSS
jgi:hypothetical protein